MMRRSSAAFAGRYRRAVMRRSSAAFAGQPGRRGVRNFRQRSNKSGTMRAGFPFLAVFKQGGVFRS